MQWLSDLRKTWRDQALQAAHERYNRLKADYDRLLGHFRDRGEQLDALRRENADLKQKADEAHALVKRASSAVRDARRSYAVEPIPTVEREP